MPEKQDSQPPTWDCRWITTGLFPICQKDTPTPSEPLPAPTPAPPAETIPPATGLSACRLRAWTSRSLRAQKRLRSLLGPAQAAQAAPIPSLTSSLSSISLTKEKPPSDETASVSATVSTTVPDFPHPSVSLPPPQTTFDLRLTALFASQPTQTPKCPIPIYPLTSGTFNGTFATGVLTEGGHTLPSAPTSRTKLNTAFTMHTSDEPPAVIQLCTKGYLDCNKGVLESFFGGDADMEEASEQDGTEEDLRRGLPKSLDPRKYSCRMVITMTTTDRRYADDLNMALWVGSGMWRTPHELIIDAYRLS